MCWVRPGVFDAKASWRCCAGVLVAEDLPALLRPTNAISGRSPCGSWSSRLAVVRKRVECSQARPAFAAGDTGAGVGATGECAARGDEGLRGRREAVMVHCKIAGFA